MNTKKASYIFLVLLIFSLIITGCNGAERPVPQNDNQNQQNTPNVDNNANTNINNPTDDDQPRVENDAIVNDKRTKDNIMPDPPQPVTPTAEAGFTLDHVNEFDLNVVLTNNEKVDMKYIKGVSNKDSRIETVFIGK